MVLNYGIYNKQSIELHDLETKENLNPMNLAPLANNSIVNDIDLCDSDEDLSEKKEKIFKQLRKDFLTRNKKGKIKEVNSMTKVVVGIINKDNKLLMIKRVKKEGNLVWSFPSGKKGENETPEEACIREVYEETNLNVEVIKELGTRTHPDTKVSLTYYLCSYLSGEAKITHPEEVAAIEFKTQEEFNRDVTTDIYGPVKKYIRENIK